MGGGQKGKKPGDAPVQKGGISKKKPEAAKAADGAPKRKPRPKGKGDRADDDALIASLISCAAGNDKALKKGDRDTEMDMELVAALAAEACLPARHGGCESRYALVRPVLRTAGGVSARCWRAAWALLAGERHSYFLCATPIALSVCSEAEEPLPASYLGDEENHLSLQEEDLRGSGEGADDDGVMIAHLIDGAAEKTMDMELVAALAADAMTPSSGAGEKRSFANEDGLATEVDDFMNGSSESFAMDAQQDGESRGEREASNADTEMGYLGDEIDGDKAKAGVGPASRGCQQDKGLRREDNLIATKPGGAAPR